ncbi:hypothetical protein M501DRAFT_1017216 [Patellaria atrata CBS 101060]|uniref:Uncharacterized protein n=1 Tax=Patellaria atrata CBS 101060 TaxID=1346257 RepID=A0A9P4S900_9PEZI|nr:hypothetical protein M501DRAFT_1017216 [Patellaria atrata CBS 101060]
MVTEVAVIVATSTVCNTVTAAIAESGESWDVHALLIGPEAPYDIDGYSSLYRVDNKYMKPKSPGSHAKCPISFDSLSYSFREVFHETGCIDLVLVNTGLISVSGCSTSEESRSSCDKPNADDITRNLKVHMDLNVFKWTAQLAKHYFCLSSDTSEGSRNFLVAHGGFGIEVPKDCPQ